MGVKRATHNGTGGGKRDAPKISGFYSCGGPPHAVGAAAVGHVASFPRPAENPGGLAEHSRRVQQCRQRRGSDRVSILIGRQVHGAAIQGGGGCYGAAGGRRATWSPHRSVTISPARDVALHAPVFCAVYDPNDRRSLYDRLKEQKDAKQEEWEEQHKFKNQMDHWKLDVDDAAFEEVRVALSPSMPSCLFTPFVVPATATAVGARAYSCAHGDHLLPRMPL
eukprot:scaffold14244_cov129-Isochrysis_galbana.AAC.7